MTEASLNNETSAVVHACACVRMAALDGCYQWGYFSVASSVINSMLLCYVMLYFQELFVSNYLS